ncbi:MAG: hypothetical protein AAB660_02765 [Patescibacteria group bacterium]
MKSKRLVWGVGAIIVIGLVVWLIVTPAKAGKLDTFATCLRDSGTKFYGAFWCPHCQKQKAMFGKSAGLLPYIECSTPNGQGTLQVCKDAKIEGYPTWVFPDTSRLSGEIELKTLAEKTSCELPPTTP